MNFACGISLQNAGAYSILHLIMNRILDILERVNGMDHIRRRTDVHASRQNNNVRNTIDYGPQPFAVNIEKMTLQNNYFRRALWTGIHLQLTLMSINPCEDIGLELHTNLDQFICIEQGHGIVKMGRSKDCLDFEASVHDGCAFIIPACTWHNLINTGDCPIKLFSIYAPPQHPFGTVHVTREDAQKEH